MARSRADAANTYDQLLHPFDEWTFGAYAHEAGQFGIGEAKGTVNFVAGTAVSLSPELMLLDEQTGGRLSEPIATTGTQAAGSGFIQPVLFVATFFVDPEEVLALGGKGAKMLGRLKRDGCFIAGTPVQMADGSTKPIERVKAGDWVKSRDPKTGVTEAKRVLQTTVRQTGAVLTLSLTDAKTGHQEQITTTGEHPFYVDGKGFVKAGDLGIGTSIVTRAGPALTLSHVTWAQSGPAGAGLRLGQAAAGYTVYNLIVEGDHTYFVGTTGGGAWVHNVDCPIPTKAFEVGTYKELFNRAKGQGLEIHHLPQKNPAGDFIPNYDSDQGVAIALPRMMHRQLPGATSRLRGSYAGISTHEQRMIISRQLRDLKNANVPKDALRELGGKIRSTYPSVYR